MKAMLRQVDNNGVVYTCLMFVCPGCAEGGLGQPGSSGLHMLPVNTDKKTPAWTWDGDLEKPTINPSILTTIGNKKCHSYLKNGIFEFLSDCDHSLKDQHIPIPDLPDWVTEENTDG